MVKQLKSETYKGYTINFEKSNDSPTVASSFLWGSKIIGGFGNNKEQAFQSAKNLIDYYDKYTGRNYDKINFVKVMKGLKIPENEYSMKSSGSILFNHKGRNLLISDNNTEINIYNIKSKENLGSVYYGTDIDYDTFINDIKNILNI